MNIRKAHLSEREDIMRVYAVARTFMAQTGNPHQWGTNYPPIEIITRDITQEKLYVCVEQEKICAVFFYDYGAHIEPCYDVIHDGQWLSDTPYGVVHRVASDGTVKGAGRFALTWAIRQCGHVRIDTHDDNKVMQHVLTSMGFQRVGWINVLQDDAPRHAFEIIA